ncbi:MAG: helix-turn-helix transcriptional regulator [Sphingobium sp.]
MRRAERLFQIVQILRRTPRPIKGAEIAGELEVSLRTVYRDIADLIGQRVPIHGEAGLGYILDDSFDMPALMLTPDEIEAAVLGAQWVAERGDAALAIAARDLLAKITSVVPERLRTLLLDPSLRARSSAKPATDGVDMARVRAWIREGRKIRLYYRDEHGSTSQRLVWPVMVGFFDHARVLAGWCELRQAFRHFRTDRIVTAEFLEDFHGERPGLLRRRWKAGLVQRDEAGVV